MKPLVVVGVGGGIAAYKVTRVVRELQHHDYAVRVIPTQAATHFVGDTTWHALSGQAVTTSVFDGGATEHVEIARHAQAIVIAPATADLIARLAAGMANDLLTTVVLAAHRDTPVILAPAMHSAMWTNAATQDNIQTLRTRGMIIIEPDDGPLSSGDSGTGRLPDPLIIMERVLEALEPHEGDLAGRSVLITAGGTQEPIDPVRFIGNRSSGRQGCALAAEARRRGADVTLVAANIDEHLIPHGITVIPAPTAAEMYQAVTDRIATTDIAIMAAAVADFRPIHVADDKIKKDPSTQDAPAIELERTTDILASVAHSPQRPPVLVGFAAETGSPQVVLERGADKARRKAADLLAINAVGNGQGFGDVESQVVLVDREGQPVKTVSGSKVTIAAGIIDEVAQRIGKITR